MSKHHSLIISTLNREGTILKSELWDTTQPKGLGHPFSHALEKTEQGVRIRDLRNCSVQEISDQSLEKAQISINKGALQLKLHSTSQPRVVLETLETSMTPTLAPTENISLLGPQDFKKICARVFGSLTVAFVLSIVIQALLPAPKEELVPAQFAKIIMKPMARSETQGVEGHQKPINVVQTFKSAAVQHSTQALLKASIVSLLAKTTPFSASQSKTALNQLFAQTPSKLNANDTLASRSISSLNVGTLAGTGSKNPGSYSAGEHAGVANQGNVFVSLDAADAVVDEGLSKDEVGKVIHAHIAEVRYCYESAMLKNPDVQGKLIVNFVIHSMKNTLPNGTVKTAKINSSTVGDEVLDQCIISHLSQWKFPKPRGGVEVAVAYPFIFKSLGK